MTYPNAGRIFMINDDNRPYGKCKQCGKDVQRVKTPSNDPEIKYIITYVCPTHGNLSPRSVESYIYPS